MPGSVNSCFYYLKARSGGVTYITWVRVQNLTILRIVPEHTLINIPFGNLMTLCDLSEVVFIYRPGEVASRVELNCKLAAIRQMGGLWGCLHFLSFLMSVTSIKNRALSRIIEESRTGHFQHKTKIDRTYIKNITCIKQKQDMYQEQNMFPKNDRTRIKNKTCIQKKKTEYV